VSAHDVVSFDAQPWHVVLTCSCGREFQGRTEDEASSRHYIHARVEASREAIRQGRARLLHREG
jgi:hypothetical protein